MESNEKKNKNAKVYIVNPKKVICPNCTDNTYKIWTFGASGFEYVVIYECQTCKKMYIGDELSDFM